MISGNEHGVVAIKILYQHEMVATVFSNGDLWIDNLPRILPQKLNLINKHTLNDAFGNNIKIVNAKISYVTLDCARVILGVCFQIED